MPTRRWLFMIVLCLAGGNASATRLKMLVMRPTDVQGPAPLRLRVKLRGAGHCTSNSRDSWTCAYEFASAF